MHLLLARRTAVERGTQKVRKAVKRGVEIVDIDEFVKGCVERGKVYSEVPGDMNLTERAREVAESKKKEKEVGDNDNGDHNLSNEDSKNAFLVRDIDGNLVDPDAEGWSEPVQLDCCCVCHENNPPNTITDCEWCKTCNINLALKKLAMVKK